MKRFIVLAAGSLALVAGGAAFAGGGCSYGKHQAAMAAADTEGAVAEEALSAELLARLKRQEEESLEQSLEVPPVHN